MSKILEVYKLAGGGLDLVCAMDDEGRAVGEWADLVRSVADRDLGEGREDQEPATGEAALERLARSFSTGYTVARVREGRISNAVRSLELDEVTGSP